MDILDFIFNKYNCYTLKQPRPRRSNNFRQRITYSLLNNDE